MFYGSIINTAINSDGIDHSIASVLGELKSKVEDLNEKLQALTIDNCILKPSNLASITQHIDAHNDIIGVVSDMHDEDPNAP